MTIIHQPFFVPSSLFIILAVPLILGLIPRNRFYGVRTSKTLSDDSVWYRTNRVGGWALIVSGGIYLAVARAFPMSGSHDPDFNLWLIQLCAFLAPLLAGMIMVLRYSAKLVK